MRRILKNTGGRPAKNEDFSEYEQLFSIMESYMSEFSESQVIFEGCVLSDQGGGLYDISAGTVWYNGNLCIFEGASGVSLPWTFETEDSDIDVREYFDGLSKATITEKKLVYNVAGSGELDLTTKRLSDYTAYVPYRTDKIEIGDWNMDLTSGVSIDLTALYPDLTFADIISVEAYIFSDTVPITSQINMYNLSIGGRAHVKTVPSVSTLTIELERDSSGFFDADGFDNTPYNRGHVLITYNK